MSLVDSLQSCMKQEDTLISEFSSILEEETEVLVSQGSVEALNQITERKRGIAQQLVDLSHVGTEQAAAQYPQLSGVWQALLSKSASASEINMRNGALIDVHLRYTQQSLDALRNVGVGSASTYDAQGRGARSAPGRRPIVAG